VALPARLYANVASAYREFRNEAAPRTRHAIATRWSNWRRRAGSRSSSDPPGNEGAGNGHADEHPAAATASRRSGTGRLRPWQRALGRLRGRRARRAMAATAAAADAPRRPNIVIILGDDLGFADMGSFGGEIRTPNLDALAREGVRYTNFYTHASCSPTRSILLTGVDTHRSGLATWTSGRRPTSAARSLRGLPQRPGGHAAAAAQGCRLSHLHGRQVAPRQGARPDPGGARFERDFSLLDGAGSYWDMTNFTGASPKSVFTEDGRYLTKLPDDYYATKTYTDKLIGFIDANRGDGKPFFAYVATRRRTIRITCARLRNRTSASTTRAGTRCGRNG